MITRGMNPEAPGLVHWSVAPLIGNDSLQTELKTKPYREKAVVPSLSWLKQKTPESPDVEYDFSEEGVAVSINKAEAEISNWIVYYKYDDTWSERILNKKRKQLILPYTIEVQSESVDSLNAPQISLLQEIQVTYIDRFGFESKASIRNLDK